MCQLVKKAQQFIPVWQVKECRWFIENDDPGILSQRAGNHGFLAFAIAELMQHFVAEVTDSGKFNGTVYGCLICIGEGLRSSLYKETDPEKPVQKP